jgi:2-keto-4-pentenoate hydratase
VRNGGHHVELGAMDLRSVQMTMVDRGGTVVSTGSGAACLGDPVLAPDWLVFDRREP